MYKVLLVKNSASTLFVNCFFFYYVPLLEVITYKLFVGQILTISIYDLVLVIIYLQQMERILEKSKRQNKCEK